MSDLNELFNVLAEGKKHYEENDPKGKKLKEVKEHVKVDLNDIFSQLVSAKKQLEEQLETIEAQQVITEYREPTKAELNTTIIPQDIELPTPEERSVGIKYDVDRYLKTASFQQPDPDTVSPDVNDIRAKIKFLEQAIGRIAATGPGGGEVNLRWLDDVDRSTITNNYFLRYNESKKKFDFTSIVQEDGVQSDWAQTDDQAIDYIKNKPSPYTLPIATTTVLGGVKVDGTTITAAVDGTISTVPAVGSGVDYIEVYDRTPAIPLTATPTLLKPASTGNHVGITYDASTGEFTFANNANFSLSLIVNAIASASNQNVYIYAEQDTGSGWVVNANSGKQYALTVQGNYVQIVYSQAVRRTAGQKVRYWIWSNSKIGRAHV